MPGVALQRRRGRVSSIPPGWVHPPCLFCQGPLERHERETRYKWRHRGCCSQSCAALLGVDVARQEAVARFAAAELVHAPCFGCQGSVPHRDGEAMGRYMERATCQTKACRSAYRKHVMAVAGEARRRDREEEEKEAAQAVVEAERAAAEVNWIGAFEAHNIVPPPELGRVYRPFLQSYGVASGWAVRGGR